MRNRPYDEVKGDFIFGLTVFITFMIVIMMAMY
jgi:hypothetical protein